MQILIHLPLWGWLKKDESTREILPRQEEVAEEVVTEVEPLKEISPLDSPDHHDTCPFDYLLSAKPSALSDEEMVQRTGARDSPVRGRRIGDASRGSGKTVRFVDNDREGNVGGATTEFQRPYFEGQDDEGEGVRRGRFYRRKDGRFVLKKDRPLDTPGVYGPIPYSRTQPISPQDIIRNIRYPDWSVHKENHENCPFREILRIRPVKAPPATKETKSPKRSTSAGSIGRRASSPSTRKTEGFVDMSVKGFGASGGGGWNKPDENGWSPGKQQKSNDKTRQRHNSATESDTGMWRKWSPAKESPSRGWGRGRRTVSFADIPSSATNGGWPKAYHSYPEHGVGCKFRRVPNPLPWYLQCDVTEPGPIFFGVLPGLYVGNFRDSKDPEQLKTHNITHILSIHDNARKLPCNSDKEYMCIVASDSPGQNLTQYFPACNDFIHTARLKGGGVLIHCLAGMSRSVTVAVVYVMCVTSLSWRDSLKAVRGARNVANPNVGFLKQIQDFENDRLSEERRRLRAKYHNVTLEDEDEQMAKQLLASYYHSMSIGEMCEGNCPPGVACPRGLCHPPRSLFRRSSKKSPSTSKKK